MHYIIFNKNGIQALQHYQQIIPNFQLDFSHIENDCLLEATFSINSEKYFAMDSQKNMSNTSIIQLTVETQELFTDIINSLSHITLIEPHATYTAKAFTWFVDIYGIDWQVKLSY